MITHNRKCEVNLGRAALIYAWPPSGKAIKFRDAGHLPTLQTHCIQSVVPSCRNLQPFPFQAYILFFADSRDGTNFLHSFNLQIPDCNDSQCKKNAFSTFWFFGQLARLTSCQWNWLLFNYPTSVCLSSALRKRTSQASVTPSPQLNP